MVGNGAVVVLSAAMSLIKHVRNSKRAAGVGMYRLISSLCTAKTVNSQRFKIYIPRSDMMQRQKFSEAEGL
jgi:hypothetical protein